MSYILETQGPTLKGVITCGSKPSHNGKNTISLELLMEKIDIINQQFVVEERITLPCTIKEAQLGIRTKDTKYKEKLYDIEFATSPRLNDLNKDEFNRILVSYVFAIGKSMRQERMYLEFDGKISVYRSINSKKSKE